MQIGRFQINPIDVNFHTPKNVLLKIQLKKKLIQKGQGDITIIRDFRVDLELVVGFGEQDKVHIF